MNPSWVVGSGVWPESARAEGERVAKLSGWSFGRAFDFRSGSPGFETLTEQLVIGSGPDLHRRRVRGWRVKLFSR